VLGFRICLEAKLSCHCHALFLQNSAHVAKMQNFRKLYGRCTRNQEFFRVLRKKISARVPVTQQKGSA
jgi:hypothetical protein